MPDNLAQQELWTKLDTLPRDVRELFFSAETSDIIYNIATKWDVLSKVSALAEITGATIIGILPMQQFRQMVQDGLEVDEKKARAIATDIRDKIFSKVAESLRKIHSLR